MQVLLFALSPKLNVCSLNNLHICSQCLKSYILKHFEMHDRQWMCSRPAGMIFPHLFRAQTCFALTEFIMFFIFSYNLANLNF